MKKMKSQKLLQLVQQQLSQQLLLLLPLSQQLILLKQLQPPQHQLRHLQLLLRQPLKLLHQQHQHLPQQLHQTQQQMQSQLLLVLPKLHKKERVSNILQVWVMLLNPYQQPRLHTRIHTAQAPATQLRQQVLHLLWHHLHQEAHRWPPRTEWKCKRNSPEDEQPDWQN